MIGGAVFLIVLFLSLWIFFIPRPVKYFYSLFLLTAGIVLSTAWCYEAFSSESKMMVVRLDLPALGNSLILTIDRLSAFFIIVVNITVFTGFLYARGYLEPY